MSILTRVDVCLVCAYICCFFAAVQGTSQECADDEVCLLQNLVRKPSVSPGESGGSEVGSDDDHMAFLQMTSAIDDALRDASHEALKDLTKFCTMKAIGQKFFKTSDLTGGSSKNYGLSTACKGGVIWPELSTKSGRKLIKVCNDLCLKSGGITDRAGKKKHDCFAVATIEKNGDTTNNGCWFMTRASSVLFPDFATALEIKLCFGVNGAKPAKPSGIAALQTQSASHLDCKPSLQQLKSLINGAGKKVGSKFGPTHDQVKADLIKILNKATTKKDYAKGVTLDASAGKITFEDGDVIFNLVGLGPGDLSSGKMTTLENDIKAYVLSKLDSQGSNVPVVKITQ